MKDLVEQEARAPSDGRMGSIPIAVKELIPILAAAMWGLCWKGSVITCYCDNVVAVSAVQFSL